MKGFLSFLMDNPIQEHNKSSDSGYGALRLCLNISDPTRATDGHI